jgi:hypothetical protein
MPQLVCATIFDHDDRSLRATRQEPFVSASGLAPPNALAIVSHRANESILIG